MIVDYPALRGRRGILASLLGALAVTVSVHPADARHAATRHGPHISHAARHSTHEAGSGPPYAAIVLDTNSGNVLHAAQADELRHPASLTKIMTLYLLFERLDAGKLKPDTPLPVSEHASVQAPTKLGLKPGQTIEVEDAIRGLVTKSANDAAVVVAEAIGGDEREFADMMTRKAHALGMSRTVYRNASGLPNDEQVTTARDQALLGRAIQERFPRYYRYFATPSFTYRGQTMRNHNQLLGRVEGMDGIKTGYTQASGFNLVASVRRNNRHIVSVVLGGSSAGARDARMRTLIEEYIVAAAPHKTTTAIAEGAPPKETHPAATRSVELPPSETRNPAIAAIKPLPAETRAADWPVAPGTYSVASSSQPPAWPMGSAAPATSPRGAIVANPRLVESATPTPAVTPTGQIPMPTARPAIDPIRPIQVKTVKVKLAPTQVAALAPPPDAPLSGHIMAPPPNGDRSPPTTLSTPQPASPPPVGAEPQPEPAFRSAGFAQRAGTTSAVPFREIAPSDRERMREPERDLIGETIRESMLPEPAPHRAAAPTVHSGWIIQVGAFDVERDAREKLNAVKAKAAQWLGHASPFTEAIATGDKTIYRARFAGMQKDQAEAVCRQLKRNNMACMTIKN